MRAIYDRKATLGITESSLARAHIDRVACYLDVGSLHPAMVPDGNGRIVREELRLVATGVPVVRKGTCRAATQHGVRAERI
ncbi:MAG: hypothetical protein BRD24_09430 [Halobacteriales archaeon SW_9_67_24]|nr:MAG: hypothetical protein BRD24_09430 [Halobacteriales archaeon SW_9_67_24]